MGDLQKDLLFKGFLNLPDAQALRKAYLEKEAVLKGLDEETQLSLKTCGYSDSDIGWFDEQIRKAYG